MHQRATTAVGCFEQSTRWEQVTGPCCENSLLVGPRIGRVANIFPPPRHEGFRKHATVSNQFWALGQGVTIDIRWPSDGHRMVLR